MARKDYKSHYGYGVDVGQHRIDDLDRMLFAHIQNKSHACVLDLGAGALGLSKRLSSADVQTIAVDIADFSSELDPQDVNLEFIQADLRELGKSVKVSGVTDVVIQRTLHYLKYGEALALLKYLYESVEDKLFISISGLESEIGQDLVRSNQSLVNRWSYLSTTGQAKFGISNQVCLYTEMEIKDLLELAGWQIDTLWVSAFKNIKVVCSHS